MINNKTYFVDGFCPATNTIYQFHGCFYHSHISCYQEHKPHPLKSIKYTDENNEVKFRKVLHGENYANTLMQDSMYRDAGFNVVAIWECQWKKLKSKMKSASSEYVLEKIVPLNPRDAYYGGRTNSYHMYYKCTGSEKIGYYDITSMYPYCMQANFTYPVGEPIVLRPDDPENQPLPIEDLFGIMKCTVTAPNNLYFGILPSRSSTGKVTFPLTTMTGTWTHMELQKAVAYGYKISEIFEQHHFEPLNRRNDLFHSFNETFFDIKHRAKADGNKGMEKVAKLVINSSYGKWGYNVEKVTKHTMIYNSAELWNVINGVYTRVNVNIINNAVAIANFNINDEYSQHKKSNVYIASFVTSYARLELFSAMEKLGQKCLYSDTDSVIALCPNGVCPLELSPSSVLGGWTSELQDVTLHPDGSIKIYKKGDEEKPGCIVKNDWFTEYVSSGPKSYALKSESGLQDVCKSKGFTLNHDNTKIFNFETLRDQVLAKGMGQNKANLIMHKGEMLMKRKNFSLLVEKNNGKRLKMVYDKRGIMKPTPNKNDEITDINTLPLGHIDHSIQQLKEVFNHSPTMRNCTEDILDKIKQFL